MHEEQGFLDQLRAHPEDEVTRLVYTDWLEERGDLRAEYLRVEQELTCLEINDPRRREIDEQLNVLMPRLSRDWLHTASRRFDVWVLDYPGDQKISTIKDVREVTKLWLGVAKLLVENAPACVFEDLPRPIAEQMRSNFTIATAVLRLATAPGTSQLPGVPFGYALLLSNFVAGQAYNAVCTLASLRGCSEDVALEMVRHPHPVVADIFPTLKEAQIASEQFAGMTAVNIEWSGLIPSLRKPRPAPRITTYSVYLTDYPARDRLLVMRAIRQVCRVGLGAAKEIADRPTPVLIAAGLTQDGAQAMATAFPESAEISIRAQTEVREG